MSPVSFPSPSCDTYADTEWAITTTNTTTLTSTLPTSTTTIPCKTLTKTRTIIPPAVTVIITLTATRTLTIKTISTTSSTLLITTATCIPPAYSRAPDPVYTGQKIVIPANAGQNRKRVAADIAMKRDLKLLKRGPGERHLESHSRHLADSGLLQINQLSPRLKLPLRHR